jgi:hypothetical protein
MVDAAASRATAGRAENTFRSILQKVYYTGTAFKFDAADLLSAILRQEQGSSRSSQDRCLPVEVENSVVINGFASTPEQLKKKLLGTLRNGLVLPAA